LQVRNVEVVVRTFFEHDLIMHFAKAVLTIIKLNDHLNSRLSTGLRN